jgi:hypothetical protein
MLPASHVDTCGGEDRVESGRELGIAVAEQEPESVGPLIEAHQQVPGLLRHPVAGRVRGDTDDLRAPQVT